MDANAMFHRFNLLYEGGKLFNRTFNTREISDFLTLAQLELIKERYASWKNRPQRGYGAGEVRDSELAGLQSATARIKQNQFIKGTMDNGALPNPDRTAAIVLNGNEADYSGATDIFGVFAPLPNECVYTTYEYVTTRDASNNVAWNIPVKEITREQYYMGIYDKYAQPYNDLVWSMDWGNFTTSTFNESTGVFADSAKNTTGNNNPGTYVTAITSTTNAVSGDNYYISSGSAVYKTVTYNAGDWFTADDTSSITIVTANVLQYHPTTVNINTIRAKYLLPGQDLFILEYAVHYLKLPNDIVVNLVTPASQVSSELADFLHEEIVTKAVKMASASIIPEQGKYNINKTEDIENQ